MLQTDRERIEAEVKRRVASALNRWYRNVYPSVRFMQKQDKGARFVIDESGEFTRAYLGIALNDQGHLGDGIDWAQDRQDFTDSLRDSMLWAAGASASAESDYWTGRGKPFDPNPSLIYDQYEIGAEGRIGRIAATTERRTRGAIDEWMGNDDPHQELIGDINEWYGDKRADRIAEMETAYLFVAATLDTMRQVESHRWQWVHDGDDEPCELFCAPFVGMVFTMNHPMPPFSTHVGCHCYPDIVSG